MGAYCTTCTPEGGNGGNAEGVRTASPTAPSRVMVVMGSVAPAKRGDSNGQCGLPALLSLIVRLIKGFPSS